MTELPANRSLSKALKSGVIKINRTQDNGPLLLLTSAFFGSNQQYLVCQYISIIYVS